MLKKILLATTILAAPALAQDPMTGQTAIDRTTSATTTTAMTETDQATVTRVTSNWPSKVRETINTTIQMYGPPTQAGPVKLIWMNDEGQNSKLGSFKSVTIRKMEVPHKFPVAHTDFLTHTVNYKVPADKANELIQFDGSVTFDRTAGTLSATCDTLEHNILALNLANDVATGKRNAEDARQFFAQTIDAEKKGEKPEYLTKLMFTPAANAADPDMAVSASM